MSTTEDLETVTTPVKEMPRLKRRYLEEIAPAIRDELGIDNVMRTPKLEKIVVNVGLGEAVNDSKALEGAMRDLAIITGPEAQGEPGPQVHRDPSRSVRACRSACKVTLRGDRMWEFFDRLLSVALPRVRDFRGLSPKSFDGRGNYTFGLTEQLVFPEIDYDDIDSVRGMDVTIVTTAEDDEQGHALLAAYDFPFVKS